MKKLTLGIVAILTLVLSVPSLAYSSDDQYSSGWINNTSQYLPLMYGNSSTMPVGNSNTTGASNKNQLLTAAASNNQSFTPPTTIHPPAVANTAAAAVQSGSGVTPKPSQIGAMAAAAAPTSPTPAPNPTTPIQGAAIPQNNPSAPPDPSQFSYTDSNNNVIKIPPNTDERSMLIAGDGTKNNPFIYITFTDNNMRGMVGGNSGYFSFQATFSISNIIRVSEMCSDSQVINSIPTVTVFRKDTLFEWINNQWILQHEEIRTVRTATDYRSDGSRTYRCNIFSSEKVFDTNGAVIDSSFTRKQIGAERDEKDRLTSLFHMTNVNNKGWEGYDISAAYRRQLNPPFYTDPAQRFSYIYSPEIVDITQTVRYVLSNGTAVTSKYTLSKMSPEFEPWLKSMGYCEVPI